MTAIDKIKEVISICKNSLPYVLFVDIEKLATEALALLEAKPVKEVRSFLELQTVAIMNEKLLLKKILNNRMQELFDSEAKQVCPTCGGSGEIDDMNTADCESKPCSDCSVADIKHNTKGFVDTKTANEYQQSDELNELREIVHNMYLHPSAIRDAALELLIIIDQQNKRIAKLEAENGDLKKAIG